MYGQLFGVVGQQSQTLLLVQNGTNSDSDGFEVIRLPVADPIADSIADLLADPLAEPVADPLTDPIADPVADPLAGCQRMLLS